LRGPPNTTKLVALNMYLQADVEHHRGHHVEVGEVGAQPPGQVEKGDQRAREPLAEGAVGATGRRRARHMESACPSPSARPPSHALSLK
uniref:Uncharacterized protein n=1 Tax=Ursus americanus TaxID=9643 RepID=A0A452QPR1_URSAM